MTIDLRQVVADSATLLPNIDRPIDNTALQAYLACPREYFLGMIQHRRSKGKSPALVFGSAWHKAMEMHYITDGYESIVVESVENSWEGHDSPTDYRTLNRCLLDYNSYRRKYGAKPSSEPAKTVGYPAAPLVELATNAMGSGLIHPWAGKLDRFIEMDGLIYVEDHKTTSRLDKNYFKQYSLSYQMKGYTYLAQQVMPEAKIAGVRINLSHVLTNKTEFHREIIPFSKDQIDEWVGVTNQWMKRLNGDYASYHEMVKTYGESFVPWEELNDAFPPHFGDNGCSRKFGMCGYWQVCSIGNSSIRTKVLEKEYEINPWNPLEADDDE